MMRTALLCAVLAFCSVVAAEELPTGLKGSAIDLFKDFGSSLRGGDREFLDPDRAFVLSVDIKGPKRLLARWEIEDGYYLYRDKFGFRLDQPGVSLGPITVPPGTVKEDPTFGRVEIHTGRVQVEIPLLGEISGEIPAQLVVRYQGCAEAGICYPPIEKSVPITLAAASASPGGRVETALSAEDSLARRLARDTVLPTLASFLGFGLLLSFTPCVFPMVPILSGLLAGGGAVLTSRRAFVLSSVYVLAMATTYAAIGVIAGLFGKNLQAVFQNTWVVVAFASVFVLLALSMLGLFKIQTPSGWQTVVTELSNRQAGGTVHGVAAMGLLSALIVGPCVAPPLAGALIYIGQSGDALLGGLALFSLALGMGLPLVAIGTSVGRLLPHAGVWMEKVQAVFGVVLLGVALWFLERVLPAPLIVLLWGVLLITAAIFMGATDTLDAVATAGRRLWKGLGLAVLVYGATLVVGAAGGASDIFRPLGELNFAGGGASGPPGKLAFNRVRGLDQLEQALREAKAQSRPVMLDLYAEWCVECKQLEKHTFADRAVRDRLAGMVLLQADVTANDVLDQELLQSLGVYGPPAVLFYGTDSVELRGQRVVGFLEPKEFLEHLRGVES